jgi:hypothetical protein
VTLVAKQLDPATQSKGSENVNSEMQLPTYQNGVLHHLATVIALA